MEQGSIKEVEPNSTKPLRPAQPELQDSTFNMDSVEPAIGDGMHMDLTMEEEMHESTPEGLFSFITNLVPKH